jgi:putative membrane protein
MWTTHEGMGWWMLMGTVWFVFFWAAFLWALTRLLSSTGREREARADAPLEIAKRRYARGEISRDEFERLRRDLLDQP